MKDSVNYAAACGLYCGDCEFLDDRCAGCNNAKGNPFWIDMDDRDACGLYDCCVNRKNLEHCGFCGDLPCESFLSQRDPALSDEEFEESLKQRQKDLIRRKEAGTAAWLKERK